MIATQVFAVIVVGGSPRVAFAEDGADSIMHPNAKASASSATSATSASAVTSTASSTSASSAFASATATDEPDLAFPLTVPHEKHWTRAGLEVGAVLFVGFVDYLLNTGGRGGLVRENDQKWAFRYDWPSLRGKLVWSAYDLDGNKFGTNYASHPAAGSAYFQVARANHLSFTESLLFATLGSTTWEYFGEIREKNSVNDLIVTPAAGAAIGEPLMQLAGFFDRGRDQLSNHVLSTLFSPIKALNDFADGTTPARAGDRADEVDVLGFPRTPWHRFHVFAGGGLTMQEPGFRPTDTTGTTARSTRTGYADVAFGLETEIVNLRGYRGIARRSTIFDDGNISGISLTGAISRGDLVDMTFATRAVPIGFYWQDVGLDRSGHPSGQTAWIGMRIGFTYGMHDYDRDRQRPVDIVSTVSPLGVEAEYAFDAPHLRVRVGASVTGSIAGVTPYALPDWTAAHGNKRDGLPTVTRGEGYYHAFGASVSPKFELRMYDQFVVDATMGFETFRGIEGLDEAPETVDPAVTLRDRRTFARGAFAWEPTFAPLRASLRGDRRLRSGDVGEVAHASRAESTFLASLGVMF